MANWAAMSMRRLLGGGRMYCNMAAKAASFHPDFAGGSTSIVSTGKSPIPEGKSPLPLLLVPPEMATDIVGDATNSHYNFMRIEKQLDSDHIHKKLFLVDKKTSNNKLPWEKALLPDDSICRGSSHGWLAFVHPSTCEVGLFNPFLLSNSNVSFPYIPLPRTDTIADSSIRRVFKEDNVSDCPPLIYSDECTLVKLALSSTPSLVGGGDCNVVGISESSGKLVFCKLGDSFWTNLTGSSYRYSDVIHFSKDGRFYALIEKYCRLYDEERSSIESWDFTDTCCPKNASIEPSVASLPTTKRFPLNPQGWRVKEACFDEDGKVNSDITIKRYLVEASGELLLVVRSVADKVDPDGFLMKRSWPDNEERDWSYFIYDEIRTGMTVGFQVYKMDWSENKWEPVESLGDTALFVGINQSFSVSTHDLPQVMQNSIYFTDDIDIEDVMVHPWGYDTGVYNMEDGFIYGILPSSLEEINQLPIWILPKLN